MTLELRQAPFRWVFGETDLDPELEMIRSADTAHELWLGRLNITRAIATRRVVSRGPVTKALRLLPALKPAFPVYAQVPREEGHERLIPGEPPPAAPLQRLCEGLRRIAGELGALSARFRAAPSIDLSDLGEHLVSPGEDLSPRSRPSATSSCQRRCCITE